MQPADSNRSVLIWDRVVSHVSGLSVHQGNWLTSRQTRACSMASPEHGKGNNLKKANLHPTTCASVCESVNLP